MGQHFKPIILSSDCDDIQTWMLSHDYDCGLKLMEHSWINNPFVQRFEFLISPKGQHHKSRVVWAGDYADYEYLNPNLEEVTLYRLCCEENKLPITDEVDVSTFPYIVNHTKKLYVDKNNLIGNDGWTIHPLPILTCEGNGQGGGDYYINNESDITIVGSWARDVISVEVNQPEGYEELTVNFDEN